MFRTGANHMQKLENMPNQRSNDPQAYFGD